MAWNDTEEQLKNLDKETIIRLFLAQKEQLENLDHTLQLALEQLADLKRRRFGRSTERHETDGQILFMEIDGNIVFLDLRQYFGQKKLKDYADFFSSSSSLCCGVI